MAAMIGSCQQTVSDLLTQFQNDSLISIVRKEITILDPLEMLYHLEK